MFPIIIFIISFLLIRTKNIVLPFKKLTIQYLEENKTISDFIEFNIYANLSIGTPPQNVGHFIPQNGNFFSFGVINLVDNISQEYDNIQKEIENSLNIFYSTEKSNSFQTLDLDHGICSDIYSLYDLNQTEKKVSLNFIILPSTQSQKIYGNIDLNYIRNDPYPGYNVHFLPALKAKDVINNYYFSFIYGEYDLNYEFNYLDDNYNNTIGNLILGESPHEFAPDKYNEEDEIRIYARRESAFSLDIDEIKCQSQLMNYSETNAKINLKFNSVFIKGSIQYKNEIDNKFFNKLIMTKLCRIENEYDNNHKSQYMIYSCKNNDETQEKLKSFPTLYFEIKTYDVKFLFNYKELFKLHNNLLYFLIIFNVDASTGWDLGELFFRKYITFFNFDYKTISFYKTQIEEINKKTDDAYPDEEPEDESEEESEEGWDEKEGEYEDGEGGESENGSNEEENTDDGPKEDSDNGNKTWMIIGIIEGVLLIFAMVVIVFLVLKLKKLRKEKHNILTDDMDPEYQLSNIVN